jgi:hypothetical protein
MLTPREGFCSVFYNGYVYVMGGQPDLSLCERYSTTTRIWSFIATMHYARHDHSATIWKNFIFVIGGSPGPAGTKIERYHTDHDMWSVLPV